VPVTLGASSDWLNRWIRQTPSLPGWSVGYFRAFEDGGVHEANLACWNTAECNDQLDGLLTTVNRELT